MLGYLTRDEQIEQANQSRQPFVIRSKNNTNSSQMMAGVALLTNPIPEKSDETSQEVSVRQEEAQFA